MISKVQLETPTSVSSDLKIVLKSADMEQSKLDQAFQLAKEGVTKFKVEKDIAAFIKKEFDRAYGETWHCVVGRSFGSYVTHEAGGFAYFYVDQLAILLFKAG
eukprot:jgi/Galph1/3016/GphlegSOOS_G1660.1